MSDFKTRAVEELSALTEKVTSLTGFVESDEFSNLPSIERGLFKSQLFAMHDYQDALVGRIHRYNKD